MHCASVDAPRAWGRDVYESVLFFYDVKVFYRELHFGTAEIVDVDGKIDGAVGLAQNVSLETCHVACLDTHLGAFVQLRGIDGNGVLGIAYHAHEILHLGMGNAGKTSKAIFIYTGTIGEETYDELRPAGKVIALFFSTLDEEVAGAQHPFYPFALLDAGPLMQFALCGDVGIHLVACVVYLIHILHPNEFFNFFYTLFLGVGGDNGYIPVVIIFHI